MMGKLSIAPDDFIIIDAAIALGDWLLEYDVIDKKGRDAIMLFQKNLRRLPVIEKPCCFEYGYSLSFTKGDKSIFRGWHVTLNTSNKPNKQNELEIFSIYNLYPRQSDDHCMYEYSHEFNTRWTQYPSPNHRIDIYGWIEEFQQKNLMLASADEMTLEVGFRNYYNDFVIPKDKLKR